MNESIEDLQRRIVGLAHTHLGTESDGAYRQIIESLAYAIAVVVKEQEDK